MISLFQKLGNKAITTLRGVGEGVFLFARLMRFLPIGLRRPRLVIDQVYELGVLSLVIIVVSALFIGMVLGLQAYYTLADFGASQQVGVMVALTLVRELGPVVTALLFAGRAGSALTAEIGLMRATEQLSSMEMMAIDPERRILVPRFLGVVIAIPLLAVIFSAVGIFGGYLVSVGMVDIDGGAFWSNMQHAVSVRGDIISGLIKSVVFAVVVGWVALHKGYMAEPTSEGVSRATTLSVVHASLIVLGLDFLLTALMFG